MGGLSWAMVPLSAIEWKHPVSESLKITGTGENGFMHKFSPKLCFSLDLTLPRRDFHKNCDFSSI
jgi:hypothetical protein